MSGGSPVGNALANSQQQTPMGGGTSPLNTGGGMSGGQTQMPNFAAPQQPTQQGQSIPSVFTPEQFKPYRWPPMTREEQHRNALAMGHIGNPGDKYLQQPQYQQPYGGGFYGQQPQPMQNPFQPQQPMQQQQYGGGFDQRAINADPQGFQQYMQQMQQREQQRPGSTMFGQPQPMQNPFQQRQFQQPSPFRGGSFMQNFAPYQSGLQSLVGQMRGGRSSGRDIGSYEQYMDRNNRALASASQEVKQPTMSRAEWQAMSEQSRQPRMTMGMPQAQSPMYAAFPQSFGREQRYSVPAYSADYSGMSSATRAAMEAEAAKAAQAAAPAYDYNQSYSGW